MIWVRGVAPERSAGWGVDGFALVGMYEWCPSQHRAGLGSPAVCVSTPLQCCLGLELTLHQERDGNPPTVGLGRSIPCCGRLKVPWLCECFVNALSAICSFGMLSAAAAYRARAQFVKARPPALIWVSGEEGEEVNGCFCSWFAPRWACMSGAPASTGLAWGHQQFVSPPPCSAVWV